MTRPGSISARTKGDMMIGGDADHDILEVAMDVWTMREGEPCPDPDQERWPEFEALWQGVERLWVPGGHRRALLHAALGDWTPVGHLRLSDEVTARWAQPAALPSQMLH